MKIIVSSNSPTEIFLLYQHAGLDFGMINPPKGKEKGNIFMDLKCYHSLLKSQLTIEN